MNPCSSWFLVKRVTTAKDLLPLQKTCRIKKDSTNFMEIGSKNDEIEESASDFFLDILITSKKVLLKKLKIVADENL